MPPRGVDVLGDPRIAAIDGADDQTLGLAVCERGRSEQLLKPIEARERTAEPQGWRGDTCASEQRVAGIDVEKALGGPVEHVEPHELCRQALVRHCVPTAQPLPVDDVAVSKAGDELVCVHARPAPHPTSLTGTIARVRSAAGAYPRHSSVDPEHDVHPVELLLDDHLGPQHLLPLIW